MATDPLAGYSDEQFQALLDEFKAAPAPSTDAQRLAAALEATDDTLAVERQIKFSTQLRMASKARLPKHAIETLKEKVRSVPTTQDDPDNVDKTDDPADGADGAVGADSGHPKHGPEAPGTHATRRKARRAAHHKTRVPLSEANAQQLAASAVSSTEKMTASSMSSVHEKFLAHREEAVRQVGIGVLRILEASLRRSGAYEKLMSPDNAVPVIVLAKVFLAGDKAMKKLLTASFFTYVLMIRKGAVFCAVTDRVQGYTDYWHLYNEKLELTEGLFLCLCDGAEKKIQAEAEAKFPTKRSKQKEYVERARLRMKREACTTVQDGIDRPPLDKIPLLRVAWWPYNGCFPSMFMHKGITCLEDLQAHYPSPEAVAQLAKDMLAEQAALETESQRLKEELDARAARQKEAEQLELEAASQRVL